MNTRPETITLLEIKLSELIYNDCTKRHYFNVPYGVHFRFRMISFNNIVLSLHRRLNASTENTNKTIS